jgi:hypothetical protein
MTISAFYFHLMIAWDSLHAAESALRAHRAGVGPAPTAIVGARRWLKAARRNLRMAAAAARK